MPAEVPAQGTLCIRLYVAVYDIFTRMHCCLPHAALKLSYAYRRFITEPLEILLCGNTNAAIFANIFPHLLVSTDSRWEDH